MTASTALRHRDSDLDFCWELILRTRPNFSISYPYAAPEHSIRLIALYALFASLEELFCRVSDEEVARTKLGWWQGQLLGQEWSTSDHPVTRQLRNSGAIAPIGTKHVKNLLGSINRRMELGTVTDEAGLKALCLLVALHQMELELSLQEVVPISCRAVNDACAVMGLAQLLRESSRSLTPGYNWVPLNVLARLGVSRSDLAENRDSDALKKLLSLLCTTGLSWLPDGSDVCKSPMLLRPLQGAGGSRHWLIQLRLSIRLLEKLPGKTTKGANQLFSQNSAGDAWCAWRCARSVGPPGQRQS